jgi:hypothetical protein
LKESQRVAPEIKPELPPQTASVPEKQILTTKASDDDEKPCEEQAECSPWDYLRKTYREANKRDMDFQDECWLREQMEIRRVSPATLVELVRRNPLAGFRTPMAGLKWLLKRAGTKTRSAKEIESAAQVATARLTPRENERCQLCRNTGRVIQQDQGGQPATTDQYCQCRMGKDLERVESRKSPKPEGAGGRSPEDVTAMSRAIAI